MEQQSEIVLTREELYAKVWATPMRHLSQEYGLSDVGLAKICRKHNIPKPPVGYWAKLMNGKKVKQPPLPKVTEERLQKVTIRKYVETQEDEQIDDEFLRLAAAESDEANCIVVPVSLRSPHPLVGRTREYLAEALEAPYRRSDVVRAGRDCLDVAASKKGLSRAMRVMDALIKAIEKRGHAVAIRQQQYGRPETIVTIKGEELGLRLREKLDQVTHEPTEEEKDDKRRWPNSTRIQEYDQVPSGRMELHIEGLWRSGGRTSWSDAKKQRLETCLNSVVAGLLRAAGLKHAERLKREHQERIRQAKEQIRTNRFARIRQEHGRVATLLREAEDWQKSQKIRQYVDAVRKTVLQKHDVIQEGSDIASWLAWASAQADRIDPLIQTPPSILDREEKPAQYHTWPRRILKQRTVPRAARINHITS